MLMEIVLLIAVMLVAAIPLTMAVKLMGGEASLMKVALVNILVAVIILGVGAFFPGVPGPVTFIIMLFIYKVMFKLGWFKTFFAWLLQAVIAAILIFILAGLGFAILAL